MQRRTVIKQLALSVPALLLQRKLEAAAGLYGETAGEMLASGPFKPNWNSLSAYTTPEWYRDAKFGIWAHWGPQCQPEFGDWYARTMYIEGSSQYKYHLEKYGHPSVFGFKDVINSWKAEAWDPEALLSFYKESGAKYFMALANHHDNFDLFNSKHQPWNATKIGPKKDLIGGWAAAAKKQGLPFGVSVHAAHAWTWYETSRQSDKSGAYAGVAYDGALAKKDGKGKWWEGLDPQELYAQDHPFSEHNKDNDTGNQWDWGNGASTPSEAYCEKFYKRTIDLIDKYDPALVYFDDTALPLWPVSDVGLKIAAYYYNRSIKKNGSLQVVINGKVLTEEQRRCMVWDIERGQANKIEPLPWQTDTCIGSWHYNRPVFNNHKYKTAKTVIQTLVDVVSKNGNLMLSVPVRGDGTIDDDERKIVEEVGRWMRVNGECIYGTRPWSVFGEGPAIEQAAPLKAQGFNEGKGKPFVAEDIRFTSKGETLYAVMYGWPANAKAMIHSLAAGKYKKVAHVEMPGQGSLSFEQTDTGLLVTLPATKPAWDYAVVLKIN